ncbi:hypothetical protein [Kineococcus sp. SYSU DK005]|uniref:hypothetical protein n=1 Tax=Kineococcus sp. SYSU DK005 TaxID=3383126 RepID=UPI003D7CA616
MDPSADRQPVVLADPLAAALPAPSTGALESWWADTPPGVRSMLLAAGDGEPLPRSVAHEMTRRGLRCPMVLLPEHGRLVRRTLPPAELVALLSRERSLTPLAAAPPAG